MKKFCRVAWNSLKSTANFAVVLIACGLALLLFFGGPIAFVAESIELARLDSKTTGKILLVESVEGDKGNSNAHIVYTFSHNGTTHQSDRVFPGLFGNRGTYTGGDRIAEQFVAGQECEVYFDASAPSRCTLQYGWFSWTLAFSLFVWGACLAGPTSKKSGFQIAASSVAIYGAGIVFVGPSVVRIHELHLHFIACLAIAACVTIYQIARTSKRRPGQPAS